MIVPREQSDPSLVDPQHAKHRAAVLLQALTSPATAAVVAGLPARPGADIGLDELIQTVGDARRASAELGRLVELGAVTVSREDEHQRVALNRAELATVIDGLTADLVGERLVAQHPELRPFVTAGWLTSWPTQPAKVESVYRALADLFVAGELLDETLVNERLGLVLEDVAQARRGLVDRGLLQRDAGTDEYRVPGGLNPA